MYFRTLFILASIVIGYDVVVLGVVLPIILLGSRLLHLLFTCYRFLIEASAELNCSCLMGLVTTDVNPDDK
jgi:hypothetical protein